jgi:hypothetical protein
MTDQTNQTPFSLNNIRVRLSEIPEGFSKKLQSFITRQPDFNDAVYQLQQKQQKHILLIEQQILQMSNDNDELTQQIQTLKKNVLTLNEQIAQLTGGKNGTA